MDSSALAAALNHYLCRSILPGDADFEPGDLEQTVEFVLQSAEYRPPNHSSLTLESLTGDKRMLRLAIINDDMPFLVDSIAATIAAQGLTIDRLVHPIVPIERDGKGKLQAIGDQAADGSVRESVIYIETPRVEARQRRALEQALRATLMDVRAAVSDWPKLRDAMWDDAEQATNKEVKALLHWLNGGMLTQLGHLLRDRDGDETNPLGICRKSTREVLAPSSYERAFAWFDDHDKRGSSQELLVIKANHLSKVHRRVPLDLFIFGLRDKPGGQVQRLSVHCGIWTSAAMASSPSDVPILRADLAAITEDLGFASGGHASKALAHAFTALPCDLLIGFSKKSIARVATTMMSLVDRPRPRLALIPSSLGRHVYAFVWLPRDAISTQVRLQIQGLLEQVEGAKALDWSLDVEGGALAMLQFVMDVRDAEQDLDEAALETQLRDMLRGWTEAVERHLADLHGTSRAAAIAARYAEALPSDYRNRYDAAEAARDIVALRQLSDDEGRQRGARLYHLDKDNLQRLRLKIYQYRGALGLSDSVPALENFGFHVVKVFPLALDHGELGTIYEFTLDLPADCEADTVLDRSETIEQAIGEVLNGTAEDDPFNRLVVSTGLTARESNWLRAFYRYLRQTGMGFTIYTVVDALAAAASVTLALLRQFIALHDPDFEGDRTAQAEAARADFARGLGRVSAINDDRLLRLYQGLASAILRTNAFAPSASEAIAFKINSALVPNLPKPVPWREIFVYSRRVEGIHLRAGAVARGGLRWSDRRDDFRTEILGLMKAQRVKNAVIVPTGAKGGFYPKLLPSPAVDRAAWAAEGQASYEIFIRTLLTVTDNLVEGRVVHPEKVVVHDGEDPYFVVAADKGTARFSDVANRIAQERQFWLGDAFASGGSNGYDHKAMGITARGAWVSVQRHFLEMGLDIQKDSVTVAGCGDMSGDVFGNGMLLSKAIKLVAAFDHRSIFFDPDPDPAASWKERKRLFELPQSSWEDYDSKLISKGGGVFSRSAKSIKLTKAMQRVLDIDAQELEPDALIKAIVKAPIDLFWFGGIGTYVKAQGEADADVGDHANDGVRAFAHEIRAKVVGEGANLGFTQSARIAYSLAGGRINTDFIDNSAGVDCSDNEVNIKIALAAASNAGKLTEGDRNTLLEDMTKEVASIVLEDNRLQALALSIAEAGGTSNSASYIRLIEKLEEIGDLDRETEGLESGERLARRAADGQGLTRPELAVLLSSAKLVLQDAIEASPLASDPAMQPLLVGMFPEPMQAQFKPEILDHQLSHELVATELANRIINRLGLLPAFELAEEEGATLAAIANAFVAAENLFDMRELWAKIDQAKMPEAARIATFERVSVAMRSHMADLLRAGVAKRPPAELVAELQKDFASLDRAAQSLLGGESRQQSGMIRDELAEHGAPDAIAQRVAHLFELDGVVGLSKLAREAQVSAVELTDAFTELGRQLGLDWAQSTAALMDPSDVWERLLVAGLARDFQQMRLDFLRDLIDRLPGQAPGQLVNGWTQENSTAIRQFHSMIERAQSHSPVPPAVLAQIASQARNLLES